MKRRGLAARSDGFKRFRFRPFSIRAYMQRWHFCIVDIDSHARNTKGSHAVSA